MIGCMTNYFLERGLVLRQVCRLYMSVMRMGAVSGAGVPDLLRIARRCTCWMRTAAGAIALAVYHGAPVAEILRGSRLTLPTGQIRSAEAPGFRPWPMYLHVILPQLLYRSRPLISNQMIYALKDTSFLSVVRAGADSGGKHRSVELLHHQEAFVITIAFYIVLSVVMVVPATGGNPWRATGFEHA